MVNLPMQDGTQLQAMNADDLYKKDTGVEMIDTIWIFPCDQVPFTHNNHQTC